MGFVGPGPHAETVAVLRGLGAPVAKSDALLSVSVQPPAARRAAVVFVRPAATLPSKQLAVPYPRKSTTLPANGQPLPLSAVVAFTSATLPVVALIAMAPVASGVGRPLVPPAPAASWTR